MSISEKELPFELPVHREFYSENVSGRRFHVFDAKGNLIAYDIAEKDTDFIILACNSYFEQRDALELILKWLQKAPIKELAALEYAMEWTFPQSVLIAALAKAKGDTNENN